MTCVKMEVYTIMFKKTLEHKVDRVWRGRMRKTFSSDIWRRMVYLQKFMKENGHVCKL